MTDIKFNRLVLKSIRSPSLTNIPPIHPLSIMRNMKVYELLNLNLAKIINLKFMLTELSQTWKGNALFLCI